jgi:hypothetical protein
MKGSRGKAMKYRDIFAKLQGGYFKTSRRHHTTSPLAHLKKTLEAEMYSKRARAGNKNDNAAACLCFLNYLAFLRSAADRTDFVLTWVLSSCYYFGSHRDASAQFMDHKFSSC